MLKPVLSITMAAAAAAVMLTAASQPAEAKRKQCVYFSWNASGKAVADGWAKARKLSRACKRARRRCNRERKRVIRRGTGGRGVRACVKVINLSD